MRQSKKTSGIDCSEGEEIIIQENKTIHSSRKHSTGFTRAARAVCNPTVNQAINRASNPAPVTCHRANVKPFRQSSDK